MKEDLIAERPFVLALVSDLMLSVRLEESARAVGCELQAVAAPAGLDAALAGQPVDLVLLDLADPAFPLAETLERLRQQEPRPRILAFFPHVRKDLEEGAQSASCDLIMPRSRLLLDLPSALRAGLAGNSGAAGPRGHPD